MAPSGASTNKWNISFPVTYGCSFVSAYEDDMRHQLQLGVACLAALTHFCPNKVLDLVSILGSDLFNQRIM